MYCRNCGKEIEENVIQCPYCDMPITPNNTIVEDSGSNWWGLLGCCIPIVGLILYIVWKDTKPKSGKKAGIGALITVVLLALIALPILFDLIMVGIRFIQYSLGYPLSW